MTDYEKNLNNLEDMLKKGSIDADQFASAKKDLMEHYGISEETQTSSPPPVELPESAIEPPPVSPSVQTSSPPPISGTPPPVPLSPQSGSLPSFAIAKYHVKENGKEVGAYERNVLIKMIQAGDFEKNITVWVDGMTDWMPAINLPGFENQFPEKTVPGSRIDLRQKAEKKAAEERRAKEAREKNIKAALLFVPYVLLMTGKFLWKAIKIIAKFLWKVLKVIGKHLLMLTTFGDREYERSDNFLYLILFDDDGFGYWTVSWIVGGIFGFIAGVIISDHIFFPSPADSWGIGLLSMLIMLAGVGAGVALYRFWPHVMILVSVITIFMFINMASGPHIYNTGTTYKGDAEERTVIIYDPLTLEQAISEAAGFIDDRIKKGTRIALIDYMSPSEQLSSYIFEELKVKLKESGQMSRVVIFDQEKLDRFLNDDDAENNLTESGRLSDEAIKKLGRMSRVRFVIPITIHELKDSYYLQIYVIHSSSLSILAQFHISFADDEHTKALIGN